MKKLFLTVAAVTTALFLLSCGQPNSGTENVNDDYNKPSLPKTVGKDPLKGNTYSDDYNKWVFSDDGKITIYELYDNDWSAEGVLDYTYNEETGFIKTRLYKRSEKTASGYKLLTYDEALEYFKNVPTFEEFYPEEEWEEDAARLKLGIDEFESLGITDDANAETILRAYYNIVLVKNWTQGNSIRTKELKRIYEGLYTYKVSLDSEKTVFAQYYTKDESLESAVYTVSNGNISVYIYNGEELEIYKSNNRDFFEITEFTDNQIKAKEDDGDTIITLSYTKSWNDGAFTLKVSAADDITKAILGEDEIELRSKNAIYNFTKQN